MDIKFSCEAYVGPYENEVRNGFFFCRAGINIASVLIDGSVSACPNIHPDFIQGNIYKADFTDIWDKEFGVMRNRSWTKIGECANCDSYKHCMGNGLHLWDPQKNQLLQCHYNLLKEAT